MNTVDIEKLSIAEQDSLMKQLKARRDGERKATREAYEGLKAGFMEDLKELIFIQAKAVRHLHKHVVNEADGFRQVMAEYGAVTTKQMSFSLVYGDFKFEAKTNKVKRFDERADMAAQRLIAFLKEWVKGRDEGTDDPMYQLAMMAIERNQKGDMDYKQVSNLYKLEGKFNSVEYSAIMELFRESHIIEGTATNFYFYRRDELGIWRKIEISFNRL